MPYLCLPFLYSFVALPLAFVLLALHLRDHSAWFREASGPLPGGVLLVGGPRWKRPTSGSWSRKGPQVLLVPSRAPCLSFTFVGLRGIPGGSPGDPRQEPIPASGGPVRPPGGGERTNRHGMVRRCAQRRAELRRLRRGIRPDLGRIGVNPAQEKRLGHRWRVRSCFFLNSSAVFFRSITTSRSGCLWMRNCWGGSGRIPPTWR